MSAFELELGNLTLDLELAHLVVKILLLLFLLFYFIFTLLVLRQVNVMNHTLETVMSATIERLAQLHLLTTAVVFVLTLLLF